MLFNHTNSLYHSREVLPFMQALKAQAAYWPPAVVFAVCSSAAFWPRHSRCEATVGLGRS